MAAGFVTSVSGAAGVVDGVVVDGVVDVLSTPAAFDFFTII